MSLVAHPGGQGVPDAVRFSLALHHLEHLPNQTQPYCATENETEVGDSRSPLTRASGLWSSQARPQFRVRWASNLIDRWMESVVDHRS